MEDHGYTVVRFGHDDDWLAVVQRYPHVFGTPAIRRPVPAAPQPETGRLETDLFPQDWRQLLAALAEDRSFTIEPGGDAIQGGRVVGQYVAEVSSRSQSCCDCGLPVPQTLRASRAALQAQGRASTPA